MDQKIISLYDEYTHKPLSRQEFIRRLTLITGSTALAMGLIPMLESNYAVAETVSEQDDDLLIEDVSWPGDDATMKGYLARPKRAGKTGSVLVIHENRGLNAHIKDVARRVAKAGYVALAADALAPYGGTPADEDQAREQFAKIDTEKNLNNFLKGLDYLRMRPESNGKTGCVGFCWGGALANQLAVHDPKLQAAVAYYGRQPEAADAAKIKAKLMLHYGGLDERVNIGIPAYEQALKAAHVAYQLFVYEGANHAFNNDTAPARYDAKAAKLAWERTLSLFKTTLT